MLDEACRLLLDEVSPPGSAPGGMAEFKRTLVVSFLFKFYLDVLQTLKPLAERPSPPVSARACPAPRSLSLPARPPLPRRALWAPGPQPVRSGHPASQVPVSKPQACTACPAQGDVVVQLFSSRYHFGKYSHTKETHLLKVSEF